MVTDGSQLLGFREVGIVGVEDSFGRPNTYVAICTPLSVDVRKAAHHAQVSHEGLAYGGRRASSSGYETRSIWRNMTAVNFEVL